ncbi:murein L,D-transpeptidase [Rhodopseudomonas sp. HC1]|uniref:L,D-transpeptidase family protein n=1 Tax=Rhodopseudomonas infernalis TaxID=2897386 RepID=UPI001EE92F96|nr:murein L,D-transpeptidase family protein [Rhodopseudomonas infernalis]MCG6203960.1 murein L,D-transpeptidase [Rhodopseudomonas infernalis]
MTRTPLLRALLASAAIATSVVLAGCNSDQMSLASNAKANQPVPPKLVAAMQDKNMDLQSPMLVRLFKQEAELEVWKQDRSGVFQLLKSYPICRWSGDLGPKIREGDRQAPEGFYSISPAQMNPQSSYYLSFNTGYPNAFDKSLGRTGSQLMVHGDCSSRGCYAMTDEQIAEIYALGRESFFGGQRAFQLQAYPFKMTPANFAKHRNNPNMPFWKMLKEGNDHFEVTKQEPKVDFCEQKYVFDAVPLPNAGRPLQFNASAKCPAYTVPAEVADAVRKKDQKDQIQIADLVAKGTPVARLRTGIDGGMNQIFASKIPEGSTGLSESTDSPTLAMERAPGTIPPHVNPPRPSDNLLRAPETTAVAATPAPASPRIASASKDDIGGLLAASNRAASNHKGAASSQPASRHTEPPRPQAAVRTSNEARPTASSKPTLKPGVDTDTTSSAPARPTATISGAAPVVSSNNFDGRFSAFR